MQKVNFEFLESKGQRASQPSFDLPPLPEETPTTNVNDEPYIDFGDTIELSDDDVAF